jgi:hypothetical protein
VRRLVDVISAQRLKCVFYKPGLVKGVDARHGVSITFRTQKMKEYNPLEADHDTDLWFDGPADSGLRR